MKRSLFIAVTTLFFSLSSYSSCVLPRVISSNNTKRVEFSTCRDLSLLQQEEETTWCKKNYDEILALKEDLRGCYVIELILKLEELDMYSTHINLIGTSPWDVRTEGRSYIERIVFYETKPSLVHKNGMIIFARSL